MERRRFLAQHNAVRLALWFGWLMRHDACREWAEYPRPHDMVAWHFWARVHGLE